MENTQRLKHKEKQRSSLLRSESMHSGKNVGVLASEERPAGFLISLFIPS